MGVDSTEECRLSCTFIVQWCLGSWIHIYEEYALICLKTSLALRLFSQTFEFGFHSLMKNILSINQFLPISCFIYLAWYHTGFSKYHTLLQTFNTLIEPISTYHNILTILSIFEVLTHQKNTILICIQYTLFSTVKDISQWPKTFPLDTLIIVFIINKWIILIWQVLVSVYCEMKQSL